MAGAGSTLYEDRQDRQVETRQRKVFLVSQKDFKLNCPLKICLEEEAEDSFVCCKARSLQCTLIKKIIQKYSCNLDEAIFFKKKVKYFLCYTNGSHL